ncbi:DUF2145 domain-containing protein [Sphaerotilaceae bacterium SBD11-9]
MSRRAWAAAALLIGLLCSPAAQADSLRFCDRPLALDAAQKDKLLRLGAAIKDELERQGQPVALMSRSGLALDRFGQRYSHAGFSLRDSPDTPWAVRQLYYACDEHRPRLYDQGVAGFLLGTDDPGIGYVSVVFVPGEAAETLARAASDKRQALALLGGTYSANAYPFSLTYQNCNQWVMEMLAAAWGALADSDAPRQQAQDWLKARGYQSATFEVSRWLMLAGLFVPYLHRDDHPEAELGEGRFRVSMPTSIEAFVRDTVPGAARVEFCHNDRHIVVHRGWSPIADGCLPGQGDTVIAFD